MTEVLIIQKSVHSFAHMTGTSVMKELTILNSLYLLVKKLVLIFNKEDLEDTCFSTSFGNLGNPTFPLHFL